MIVIKNHKKDVKQMTLDEVTKIKDQIEKSKTVTGLQTIQREIYKRDDLNERNKEYYDQRIYNKMKRLIVDDRQKFELK